jgi:FAD/FMN-containing dehydrogenase
VKSPDFPWGGLKDRLKGQPLLLPDAFGYDRARAQANSQYADIRPAAVAMCVNEDDVAASVDFARTNKLLPMPRTGGHSYAGLSATTGLLLNLSRMNTVTVDPETGIAVVGGGAVNRDLLGQTRNTGWFLPVGTCPTVGIAGLTLGGGIGYNTHSAGLTCDHLISSRIVTADGGRLEISDSANQDLFWACRGGAGGNFGINTSLTFQLVKVPEQNVSFYQFIWRGADKAILALNAFHQILADAPAGFNAVASVTAVEPRDKESPRDAIVVSTRGQFIGPRGTLEGIVGALRQIDGKTTDRIEEMSFWAAQDIFTGNDVQQHGFGDISRFAAAPIPSEAVEALVGLLANCPSRTATANGSFWSMGWVGGEVVSSKKPGDTAYVHRGMQALLRPTPVWPASAEGGVGNRLITWTDDMVKIIKPYTTGSYQNFPNRRIDNWAQEYYGANLDRLRQVKKKYDGSNLFQSPQSIPPAD